MRNLFFIILLWIPFLGNSQISNSITKNKVCYCLHTDKESGKSIWIKQICNLSKKRIYKLQERLKFLEYPVVITGVLDQQTKNVLLQFNTENNLGEFSVVLSATEKTIRQKYKTKKKEL